MKYLTDESLLNLETFYANRLNSSPELEVETKRKLEEVFREKERRGIRQQTEWGGFVR